MGTTKLRAKAIWALFALCREYPKPDDFHKKGLESDVAKILCNQCPVRIECLEYALVHDEHGIWGGLTERERKRNEMKELVPLLQAQYKAAHLIEERPEHDLARHPVQVEISVI